LFAPLSLNDPFTVFLLVVAGVMVAGYLIGRSVNKRRGQAITAWLEPGMRALGGAPAVQAVNRTAFRVKVMQARNPFLTVTASVVLISRESLPTWLWEALNRRQDVLIFHLTLKQAPTMEADVVNPASDLGRRGEAQVKDLGWSSVEAEEGYRLYHSATTPPGDVRALAAEAARKGLAPWRVAVRRNPPHILISLPMPDIRSVPSADLMRWLTRLARTAHTGNGDNSN